MSDLERPLIGDLETSFEKDGKTVTRRLNSDLDFRMAGGGGVVTLPGTVHCAYEFILGTFQGGWSHWLETSAFV